MVLGVLLTVIVWVTMLWSVSGMYSNGHSEQWRKYAEEIPNLRPVDGVQVARQLEALKHQIIVTVEIISGNIGVYVDDKQLYWAAENNSTGFHVIVLSPWDGSVMLRRRFKTDEPAENELLSACLVSLQPANIIVLMPFVSAGDYLGMTERFLLSRLGMRGDGVGGAVIPGDNKVTGANQSMSWRYIIDAHKHPNKKRYEMIAKRVLTQRKAYIDADDPIVVVSHVPHVWPPQGLQLKAPSARVWAEAVVVGRPPLALIGNMSVVAVLPKLPHQRCDWHSDPRRESQKLFCSTYDGYGALCRCHDPIDPLRLRLSAPAIEVHEPIPVVMLTATKTAFFYRQLVNLLITPGAAQTTILVFTDGLQQETSQLATLFGLPVLVHDHEGQSPSFTPLNSHFRFSVYNAFNVLNTSKVIVLEDDLLLSPDFLSYFQQTAWLLDADPSIYCVNAFSVNSYSAVAVDDTRIRRSEMYPQFGWMITRNWAHELVPLWVNSKLNDSDWDWWLHEPGRRKGRHAILPEVSRTFHSGSSGAHVSGFAQAMIYSAMIYNQNVNSKLKDTQLLIKSAYEKHIGSEIRAAFVLPTNFSPCDLTQMPSNVPDGPLVFVVYSVTHSDGMKSFSIASLCLGGFYEDTRDLYEGVMQFNVRAIGRIIYVVGCPLSRYCSLLSNPESSKPAAEAVYEVITDDKTQKLRRVKHKLLELKSFNRSALFY